MRNIYCNKHQGFTAVELMMSLIILSVAIMGIVFFTKHKTRQVSGYIVANQAVDYAKSANRYIHAHYTLLEELLSSDGQGNGLMVTIPEAVLKNEMFLGNGYPDMNILRQYPCLVINYDNNQLQAFLYYRDDGNSRALGLDQLNSGLGHVGGMIGLYQNGIVSGAGSSWGFSKDISDALFIAHGTADPSQGANPGAYQCQGSNISNNSYVVNFASLLALGNHLPKDDTLHQYPDTLYPIESPENSNTMQADIIMDSSNDPNATVKQKSNMIFQMNESCVMNPQDPATMQDYAPSIELSGANPRGCRNRQLGISAVSDDSWTNISVTGTKQGGDTAQYTSQHAKQPYVGELSVASIQPTTQVAVGTICSSLEIGKMAQQARSVDPNDINNIYTSQVQCMYNPLCPPTTAGLCYTPITTVTLKLMIPQPRSDKPTLKDCPPGTFISAIDADQAAIKPKPCCGINVLIPYCCHIDDCPYDNRGCSQVVYTDPLSGYSTQGLPLFSRITTTPTKWHQGCPWAHSGCDEGWGYVSDTYIIVRSITCTNDITQIYIPVDQ